VLCPVVWRSPIMSSLRANLHHFAHFIRQETGNRHCEGALYATEAIRSLFRQVLVSKEPCRGVVIHHYAVIEIPLFVLGEGQGAGARAITFPGNHLSSFKTHAHPQLDGR
jgi:hypothetical protein